jgi:glycosyltransferase involved in cell wall biosynthesis
MTAVIQASIIICTYNRCGSLQETLLSLRAQAFTAPLEYEILVVDNNSTDATRRTVDEMLPLFAGRLRYLLEPRKGKSYALNLGIMQARGKLLLFTDDDVLADASWVEQMVRCFAAHPCDAAGGRVLPLYPSRCPVWIKECRDILSGPIVSHDYGGEEKPYDAGRMLPFVGANMAARREVFAENGLFRTDMGVGIGICSEDTEMFRRLEKADRRLYYCGGAAVHHKVAQERMNYFYIARWSIGYGRSIARRDDVQRVLQRYFGIPRYLFRDIASRGIGAAVNMFNRKRFIENWQHMFLNIGAAIEYGRIDNGKDQHNPSRT